MQQRTDASHDVHVGDHVGRVRDLDGELGAGGLDGAHGEGDDEHGAAGHAALVELGQLGLHLLGSAPVVGGAGILLVLRADEGPALHASNVAGVRARQVAVVRGGGC